MKKKIISLIIGVIIILFSVWLYIIKSPYWHYPAVIGVWIFFDSLSSLRKNKTTLDLIRKKKYKQFVFVYLGLFILGLLIEFVGRILLKLWNYPLLSPIFSNFIELFSYPFILMSFREMYNFLYSFIKKNILTVISAMLLGIIIWEVPNVFSKDWIYIIPYISFEIFHINIIVILGWVILILGPLYVYKLLKIK